MIGAAAAVVIVSAFLRAFLRLLRRHEEDLTAEAFSRAIAAAKL